MKSIKKKGMLVVIGIIIIIAGVIGTTTLSSAMTLDRAKELAKDYVPSTAEFVTSEEDDGKYELVFYDETAKETFEVEIYKDTKKVKKVESQLDSDLGSEKVILSETDAAEVVRKKFPEITSTTVNLTKDNGLYEYEVSFKADDFYGNADVNPETGVILESTIKFGSAITITKDDSKGLISSDEAKELAIKEAGGGTVKDIELEKEKDVYFYDVEVIYNGIEYEYIIDASSGKVTLENKHENYTGDEDDDEDYNDTESKEENTSTSSSQTSSSQTKPSLISKAKAKEIVKGKIPGGIIVSLELDKDDGKYVYEGEATLKGYEYEFEINAETGKIIKWEKEKIETHEATDDADDADDDDKDDRDDDRDDD